MSTPCESSWPNPMRHSQNTTPNIRLTGDSMRKLAIRSLWPVLVATALWVAVCVQHPTSAFGQNAGAQAIEVTAKKYEYSPAPIHVKSGTKIQLKITATDHDHGFSIATVPDGANSNVPAGLVFTSG